MNKEKLKNMIDMGFTQKQMSDTQRCIKSTRKNC